jgi:hypothetical protein
MRKPSKSLLSAAVAHAFGNARYRQHDAKGQEEQRPNVIDEASQHELGGDGNDGERDGSDHGTVLLRHPTGVHGLCRVDPLSPRPHQALPI